MATGFSVDTGQPTDLLDQSRFRKHEGTPRNVRVESRLIGYGLRKRMFQELRFDLGEVCVRFTNTEGDADFTNVLEAVKSGTPVAVWASTTPLSSGEVELLQLHMNRTAILDYMTLCRHRTRFKYVCLGLAALLLTTGPPALAGNIWGHYRRGQKRPSPLAPKNPWTDTNVPEGSVENNG